MKFAKLALALVALAAFASTAHAGAPLPSPEIDPSSMISAVTLFSGALLVLSDRRRRAK